MKYISSIIVSVILATCFASNVFADKKAETEAACEQKCQENATKEFNACNHIKECENFVPYNFNSCMKSCDKN